jgi:UDP-sugar transporter A1/2/3
MPNSSSLKLDQKALEEEAEHQKQFIGLLAVLCACFSSGFAGVFFEMLVKTGAQPSVVIRNLQLGIFSLFFGSIAVIYNDSEAIAQDGFFQGYTTIVFIIIALQVRLKICCLALFMKACFAKKDAKFDHVVVRGI